MWLIVDAQKMLNTASALSLFLCLSLFSMNGRTRGWQREGAGQYLPPELSMGLHTNQEFREGSSKE